MIRLYHLLKYAALIALTLMLFQHFGLIEYQNRKMREFHDDAASLGRQVQDVVSKHLKDFLNEQ